MIANRPIGAKEDFQIPDTTIRKPESELRTQAPPLLLSTGALPRSLAGTSECRGCWSPSFDAVLRQSEKAQERSRPLQGHSRQNAPKTIPEPPDHSTRLTPRQIFRALVRLLRSLGNSLKAAPHRTSPLACLQNGQPFGLGIPRQFLYSRYS